MGAGLRWSTFIECTRGPRCRIRAQRSCESLLRDARRYEPLCNPLPRADGEEAGDARRAYHAVRRAVRATRDDPSATSDEVRHPLARDFEEGSGQGVESHDRGTYSRIRGAKLYSALQAVSWKGFAVFLRSASASEFGDMCRPGCRRQSPGEIDKDRSPTTMLAIRKLVQMGFSPSIRFATSF